MAYALLSESEGETVIPKKEISKTLVNRSFLGSFGMALLYYNITTLPIHVLNTILRTSTFFTFFVSLATKRDHFAWNKTFCIIVCVFGSILVVLQSSKSNFQDRNIKMSGFNVFLALVNSLIFGIIPIMIESVKHVNPLHNSLYVSAFMILVSAVMLIVTGKTVSITSFSVLGLQITSGFAGFFMQTARNLSLRYEKATVVSVVESLSLVFAFLYQCFVLGDNPSIVGWIGGGLVLGSTVAYTFFKQPKREIVLSESF